MMLNECPGLPIIETLYEATGSKAGTVFMMLCIYVIIGASQFNILASVSDLPGLSQKMVACPSAT